MENEEGIKMEKTVNVFTENNIQIGTISEAEYKELNRKTKGDLKLHLFQLLMNAKTATNFLVFGLKLAFVALLAMLIAGYSSGDKEVLSVVLSIKSIILNGYSNTEAEGVLTFLSGISDIIVKTAVGMFYVSLLFFGMITYGEIRKLFVLKDQKKAIGDDPFFFHRSLYSDRVGLEIKTLLQEPYNGPVWVAYEE